MKKLALIFMAVIAFTTFSGFVGVGNATHLTQTGKVSEYVFFDMDATELLEAGIQKADYLEFLTELTPTLKSDIAKSLRDKVNTDFTLTTESKEKLLTEASLAVNVENEQLVIQITYLTQTTSKYFADFEKPERHIQENNIFTYHIYSEYELPVTKINLNGEKQSLASAVEDYVKIKSQTEYGATITPAFLITNYEYQFITEHGRLHSNAEEIVAQHGQFYHYWTVEDFDRQVIMLYTTHAHTWVWYVLALILTGIFALVIYIVSRLRKENIHEEEESKQPSSFLQENDGVQVEKLSSEQQASNNKDTEDETIQNRQNSEEN